VKALCQMAGLSRAGFYRWRAPRQETPIEVELRDQMQKVALESPAYGYRRITAELQRQGFAVNHKRVLRMMRNEVQSPRISRVRFVGHSRTETSAASLALSLAGERASQPSRSTTPEVADKGEARQLRGRPAERGLLYALPRASTFDGVRAKPDGHQRDT
jgi:hypothetical protein